MHLESFSWSVWPNVTTGFIKKGYPDTRQRQYRLHDNRFNSGGSEKQFKDALRVYEVQFENLDHKYIELWAEKLHVNTLLARLKNEAETI